MRKHRTDTFQRQAGGTTFCRYIKLMLSAYPENDGSLIWRIRIRITRKRKGSMKNENSINNRWQ